MLNTVIIMGRLTVAPELKSTQSGKLVTSFAVAVDRAYKGANEERQTDFIDCVAWTNTAEFISKYFHKGSLIAIVGRLQTRTYEDKNGNKRKATEVVIEQASFTGEKKNDSEGKPAANINVTYDSQADSDFEEIGADDDDLPF